MPGTRTRTVYPFEEYKQEIRHLYLRRNFNLRMLKEHLLNLNPQFNPSDRTIKNHLKKWGFIKYGKRRTSFEAHLPSSPPESSSINPVPVRGATIPVPVRGATIPVAEQTTTTTEATCISEPQATVIAPSSECRLQIEQAEAAIDVLLSATEFHNSLKLFRDRVKDDPSVSHRESQHLPLLLLEQTCLEFSPNATFWKSYLRSSDANEFEEIERYLETMYFFGEQLESTSTEKWHTATLLTVVEFLTPRHGFLEASSIFRILPIAMKSQQVSDSRKKTVYVCYQCLRNFLDFDDDADASFDFEAYQHVVRTGRPIRGPPALPNGAPGEYHKSVFAYGNYTPSTCVHYLRMALKLAMQKPVLQREHVVRFTATLCLMVNSLSKQLEDDDGQKDYNNTEMKELQLPTNNLPHELQKTPMGLSFQLQFFAWLHQTVNWDYPNCNAENLLITIVEHLISIAIVIAQWSRSTSISPEEKTQAREYLSTFAFGMNAALPTILDPKKCCWSMPSLSDTGRILFYTCRGRCTKYLKIFTKFELFCSDGMKHNDFSECSTIISRLRKETTDFTGWVRQLSANMKCTSQRWCTSS